MIPLNEDSQLDTMSRFNNPRAAQAIWQPHFKASSQGELARYHEAMGRSPDYPFEWAPGEKENFYDRASRIPLGGLMETSQVSSDTVRQGPSTSLSAWKRTERAVLRYVRQISKAGKLEREDEVFEMPGDDGSLDVRTGYRHTLA